MESWEKVYEKLRRLLWAMCHILTHSLDIGKPIYIFILYSPIHTHTP